MALGSRLTDDLVRIAAAGGGLRLKTRKSTDDLVRIAAAASGGGGMPYLSGLGGRLTNVLVRIAAAGKGHVVFEDHD